MSIWHEKVTLAQLNRFNKQTIQEVLEIQFTDIGADYLKGTMPVDHRTHQPYGLLHGGASITLAETLGSMAAHLCIDHHEKYAVGLDIQSQHIRSKQEGEVEGIAQPLHLGRSTQVWDIKIHDEKDRLINVSQLRMAVLEKNR